MIELDQSLSLRHDEEQAPNFYIVNCMLAIFTNNNCLEKKLIAQSCRRVDEDRSGSWLHRSEIFSHFILHLDTVRYLITLDNYAHL